MQKNIEEFGGIKGIKSATSDKLFYPMFNGKEWICQCEHYRIHHTACRHILEKKYLNIEKLLTQMINNVKDARELRDFECQDFDEVVSLFELFRGDEMNKLTTIMLNVAIYRGQVCTDDLHAITHENYADNRIVGAVCGTLLKTKLLKIIGRKPTERRCAHGRSINIYAVTEEGFRVFEKLQPERVLEVR